jgi:hypothetical protein
MFIKMDFLLLKIMKSSPNSATNRTPILDYDLFKNNSFEKNEKNIDSETLVSKIVLHLQNNI